MLSPPPAGPSPSSVRAVPSVGQLGRPISAHFWGQPDRVAALRALGLEHSRGLLLGSLAKCATQGGEHAIGGGRPRECSMMGSERRELD
jgi:hypothetical protein